MFLISKAFAFTYVRIICFVESGPNLRNSKRLYLNYDFVHVGCCFFLGLRTEFRKFWFIKVFGEIQTNLKERKVIRLKSFEINVITLRPKEKMMNLPVLIKIGRTIFLTISQDKTSENLLSWRWKDFGRKIFGVLQETKET